MEEKKKGKGVKVFLVIFIILFLAAALALGYGYTKYKDLENENTNLNTKYETASKDLEQKKSELDKTNKNAQKQKNENTLNYVDYTYGYNQNIKVFALYPSFMVFSVDDELYMADDPSLELEVGILQEDFKNLKFKNNIATVKEQAIIDSDDDDKDYEIGNKKITITKLNISTKEVSKIIGQHAVGFRDPTGEVYIFYKDGGLTHFIDHNINTKKVLTEYKIKDIEVIEDKNSSEGAVARYKLILEDGTTKTVNNLK